MNKNLSLSESIVNSWESYLVSSRISEESTKEKKFYVSDLGKCFRMRFLKRKGIKGEYGVDTYYTFAHGDFIHKLGYKALEASGILESTEQYVEAEHWVGKYDGKIRYNGKKVMFDFKSTNPYVMKRIVAGGSDNLENIMQVLGYVLLDKDKEDLSDSVAVVYVNKLPTDKIESKIIYPREYHLQTYKEEIKEDMDRMVEYWLGSKIPPCTCPSWSMQKYNSFYMFCHMTDKEVNKHLGYLKKGKRISSDGFKINVVDGIKE